MVLSPLYVETYSNEQGQEMFEFRVGKFGIDYQVNFQNFINLIQMRAGVERAKLEYQPREQ